MARWSRPKSWSDAAGTHSARVEKRRISVNPRTTPATPTNGSFSSQHDKGHDQTEPDRVGKQRDSETRDRRPEESPLALGAALGGAGFEVAQSCHQEEKQRL